MDKLKPILAQKFWILAGLCLILPLVGWWLDTAAMSKEITDRTTAIKGAFSNIPRPGPNQMWTDQVIAKNKEEAAKVIRTGNQLWENRVGLHVWPESVREAVEKTTFRGPIDPTTRGEYRDAYERELEELHKIVSPFNDYDSTGLVIFPFERIPTLGLGQMITHPSDQVTWDAQEDIWLYRTLLEAVARTNAHEQASTILDAIVKEILVIELRGGGPKPTGTAGGGGMPGASPMAGPPGVGAPAGGPAGMLAPAGGGFGDGMRSGANQGGGALVASFDPAEVFGPDADTSVGTGSTGGPMAPPSAMAGPPKPMGGGPGPMGGGPGPGAGGQFDQSASRKRYIEETKLFNTRGFYMEVVIDHRHVPEFLGELSDSPWPLKIVRIQQVDRDLADIGSSTVGTSMGAAMGPSSGGAAGLGMTSAGAGAVRSQPMPVRRPMGGGADIEDGDGRVSRPSFSGTRPTYSGVGGAFGGNQNGESLIDPNVALADPNLVTLAVAGIITLYLPPEPVAPAPGTPGTTPGIPGATPGAPVPAEAVGAASPIGTPAAGTTPAPTTADPATAGAAATTPATGTPPEAAPATGAESAPAATTPAGTTPPGTTPSGTEPSATTPPTTDKPATPDAAPATGEAAAGAPNGNSPATPPPGGTEKK